MRGNRPVLTLEQAQAIARARALRRYYSVKSIAERMGLSQHIVASYGRSARMPKRYQVA